MSNIITVDYGNVGGGSTVELTVPCSYQGGLVIDTQSVESVKYKLTYSYNGEGIHLRVSNSAFPTDGSILALNSYGTDVKSITAVMSDYADLLSLSEVSGYRYIAILGTRTNYISVVDLQMKS